MTANLCAVCGSTTPDGVVCVAETERARQQLLGDPGRDDMPGIVELAPAARAVYRRQTATGPTGTTHHAPGPVDPIDYQAGARLDAVQTALTGWVRAVAEDAKVKTAPRGDDLIVACAVWLAERVEVIRHLPYAELTLQEIGDCWHALRSVVATPAGRLYLGTCEADGCDGDIYGKPGRAAAYCRTCGAAYDQAERRIQVTRQVQDRGYRASVIAHAYGIPATTIRKWAWVRRDDQGQALNDPKLKPVGRDDLGRPLYLVADVLALAEAADQRRQQRTAHAAEMGASSRG